jgi:hypothetical protein
MALFIHNKNQELLWNVINKTQIFQFVFAYSQNNEPELWFRAHIQQYYQKIQNISLTSENLNNCNHEIIAIMMNNLKTFSENLGQQGQPPQQQQQQQQFQQQQLQQQQPPFQQQQSSFQQQQQPPTQLPYTVENKQELYSRQFNERQKEYELMNAKPTPPVPDINNNIKDDAISNMDELIKLHMQQREAEMKQYSPLPLVQPPLENSFKPNNIKIADNNENIRLIPDAVFINEENKLKKNVSWSDDNGNVNSINEKMYENLHKDYEELKSQVLAISNSFHSFQEEMRIFMSVVINNVQSGNRTQEPAQIQQQRYYTEQTPISSNDNVNNNTNDFLT